MLNDRNSLKMIFISGKIFAFLFTKINGIIYDRDLHNVDRVCSSLETTNFIYYGNWNPF